MSYETDYQYRQQVDKRAGQTGRQHPMDLPQDGGASKGLLIFAAVIVGFIVFVVIVSLGSSPETTAPAVENSMIQTVPEAGAGTESAPAVAPAQGE